MSIETVEQEHKSYHRWYPLFSAFMRLRFRYRVVGSEHIPQGAAMICANHTSNFDPMLLIKVFGKNNFLHIMAKDSLYKIPVLRGFLRSIGMISVKRDMNDVIAVKTALGYLKGGEKVGIFPEGHRVMSEEESVSAKTGAVKLADRTGVPVVPVFIPRKKPIFRRVTVTIGAPYYVNPSRQKLLPEETARLSAELMERIMSLDGDAARK
ncbi:MAG: 1-acyl-sn-glycerol-3-phosphate acyltransferase [Oscillospiraceae bacterium]|jgi:1-acyl-sn-glycerol-3-phosphate acyltransferase|nr:1-acyl-sn-glycerol-3-phosphate acyltransferase [Oscillospiraceae bacterium]